MVKYKTSMTEKRFKEKLGLVYRLTQILLWSDEFVEVVGQAVFSGKEIVFEEEDRMKITADEINAKLTTAAEADAAEIEESPFPIPFSEIAEQPEWDEDQPLGPPPATEDGEENGGEL